MTKKIKRIVLPILLLAYGFNFSQSDDFVVYKKFYTYAEGFPGRDVLCGAEDKYGFLWFGTRNGLCRYDGYNFILFTQKSHNLRGTKIIDLVADDSLGLIITYSESGSSFFASNQRDVINVKTYEVKPLQAYYKLLPFKEEEITSVKPGNHKELIFLTGKNDEKWTFSNALGFEQIIGRRRSFKKICLHDTTLGKTPAERKNYNNYAIYLYADSTVRIPLYMPAAPPFYYELVSKSKRGYIIYYHDFLKDKKDYYFINQSGKVFHADSLGSIEAEFNKHEARTHCTSRNDESSIIHDYKGSILMYRPGIDFTKLFQNSETERVKRIRVKSFFKDSRDSYWLCTNEGVLQVKIKKKLFKTLFTNKEKLKVSDNSTRGIYAEKNFTVCNTTDFTVVRTEKDTSYYKYAYNFSVLKQDNELWLGSFELRKLNLTTKKITSLLKSRKDEIWSIYALNNYELLLGCTGGMDIYNKLTNTIDSVDFMGFPQAKFIYRIFKNSTGQIMAVADNGLYVLSPEGVVLECYSAESRDKTRQLPCAALHDVYEDKEGNYWLASNIDGFFKWDRKKNSFLRFGKEHGFISTIICCVQEDNLNNLWLSTDFGLVKFNKKNYSIETYTEQDGISHNEFNRASSFKDNSGNLYFGGMNGVTSFNPQDFQKSDTTFYIPFRITGFTQLNVKTNSVDDRMDKLYAENEIVITDEDKFSTLYFSLLDFEDWEHSYAYKIEGLHNDWVNTSENKIQLSDLPYGNYTLKIKARLVNGNWNKQEIKLNLVVSRPFYKNKWFLLILALIVLISIYLFIKLRLYFLKKENEKLEDIVETRTSELKASLSEKTALIQEIHHRVKNNLQFIEAMLEMQVNSSKNIESQTALLSTSRRINAMILVHEMLYTKNNLESISLKTYLTELVLRIDKIINDTQIPIRFNIEIEDINFNITDSVAIGMITSEILSNSIKYAFNGIKEPQISILLGYLEKDKVIIYKIKDNGKGFEKTDNNTGYGIRLIGIFTRQLKGSYAIKNNNGLSFIFEFKHDKTDNSLYK